MAKETSSRGGKPSVEYRDHYNKDSTRAKASKQTSIQVLLCDHKNGGCMCFRGTK